MPEYACTSTPQYDAGGVVIGYCVDCPEQLATAGSAAYTVTDRQLGWNASARSVRSRTGDCYTQFSIPAATGVVCGFAEVLTTPQRPSTVPFGFFCRRSDGREVWTVVEGGVDKTAPVTRSPATDVFRIERRRGSISYFFNGARVYLSAARTNATLYVVACLYAADDGVN